MLLASLKRFSRSGSCKLNLRSFHGPLLSASVHSFSPTGTMPRIVGFKSNTKQCADFHALGQQENFKHMFTICENQVRAAGALTSGDKQMWDNIRALADKRER